MALIEARGLVKLYRMGDSVVRALDGVDLEIAQGEFVAITGASGSGKSTMMHVLGCLDRPTSGRYLFNGRDVGRLSDRQLAHIRNRQIGFVFQTFNLINRVTALDNVAVPLFYARRTSTRAAALRALERVGLANRAVHKSNELSGGERQRVAIARAIVNEPPLLLADEPTGNLDSRTGQQIMAIFRSLNEQGVTIVLVTHEQEMAAYARRIIQMRDGKIVADSPAAELLGHRTQVRFKVRSDLAAGPAPAEVEGGSVAVLEAPTDTAAPVAAQPVSRPAEVVDAPARTAPGAMAAVVVAVLAMLSYAAAVAMVASIRATTLQLRVLKEQGFSPEEIAARVPPSTVLMSGLVILCGLLGFVLGTVALAVGLRTRRWIRREPGRWKGHRRALLAALTGSAAMAVPVVVIGLRAVQWALRRG